jgi:Mg2+ and Co2+ transporter CorA
VCDIRIEEGHEWAAKPGHVVWIGLHEPSYELLSRIQGQFGLHDLAIEDAGKAHNHPKIELYGDAIFIVARTAQLVDGRIAFGETHMGQPGFFKPHQMSPWLSPAGARTATSFYCSSPLKQTLDFAYQRAGDPLRGRCGERSLRQFRLLRRRSCS